jgi:type I restriction enzyme S subunit
MIADLRPYPAMKVSGVEWIGEVPEHWDTRPLKRWVRMNAAVLPETTVPDHEFRYVDIGSVGTGVLTQKPQRLRFGSAPSRARRVVRKGDTIISTVRTYLKAVYFVDRDAEELICSTGFAVLTPRLGTLPKFVSYLARSDPFTNRVTADSVGIAYPAIVETRLGSFHVAVPPLPEQSAIVRFLDHVDRRIRRCIRAKQKLIALLHEQKQVIIHRAVTRGLDPNVRLKPSGVEWLGEVPEHWEVRKLKHVTSFLNGCAFKPADWRSEGVPIIRIQNLNGSTVFNYTTRKDLPKQLLIQPGDLLFAWSGNRGTSFGSFQWDRSFPAYLNQHVFRLWKFRSPHMKSRSGSLAIWTMRSGSITQPSPRTNRQSPSSANSAPASSPTWSPASSMCARRRRISRKRQTNLIRSTTQTRLPKTSAKKPKPQTQTPPSRRPRRDDRHQRERPRTAYLHGPGRFAL